ncbi:hypothetical protein Clacol_002397 [Clathrus columnatus]|uniref:Structural maintenance of chromosomes protein 5 n=1 Tax=Clathrus columnatus TaxID=1419009 RepID=A0AAV5A0Q3_9AGAM|nr:hypothetical protein Clacol_002397 [Clathrus columnatus]
MAINKAKEKRTTVTTTSGSRTKSGRVGSHDEDGDGTPNGDHGSEETLSSGNAEDENANEYEEENGEENGSPNGRKRARLNEGGDSVVVKDEKPKVQRAHLTRDKDGYVPGSIVRIQLKNFVTYDFVEFRPGPSLNMIFGPNGTGKSSIACAICIGLNGSPSLLGRSTELNAFVKQGYDSGYVELELKGKSGTPNLIIRRSITSKNRSSQFTLNGANSTGREITERLTELNVQVGNLCSFLPQDRVSEFAQMSPQQLLKETQHTAGDAELTTWHNFLIAKGKELVEQSKKIEDEKKLLTNLEEKQKILEKDVKRYNERRATEKQIELLNVILPYVEYKESKAEYDLRRRQRDLAHREHRQVEELNKPIKDLQAELQKQHNQLDKERAETKENLKNQYTRTITSLKENTKKAAGRAEDALERIKTLKRQEKDRQKHIAKAQEEIQKFQEKVDNPPSCEPIEPVKEQIKVVKTALAEINVKRVQLKQAVSDLVERSERNKISFEEKQRELKALEDFTNRKVQALGRWDRDCAEVVNWILANRATNEFAARIDLPAVIGVDLKDQRYANSVEACFGGNQMKTFITHSESDYREFNRIFIDTPQAVGQKVNVTVWYRPRNDASLGGPPLSPQELHSLGFEGYAIDFVECSEGLKWFLMKELNMHRTPIALRGVDDVKAQSLLTRPGPDGRPAPNVSYMAANVSASVSRSAYGQRKVMTVTRGIPNARNLVHPSVDPEAKRKIEQDLTLLQQAIDELKAQTHALKDEDQTYIEELQKKKPEHDGLVARQQAVENMMSEIRMNENKLMTWKNKLKDYEKQPSVEEERLKQAAIVERSVKERSKIVGELQTLVQEMIKKHSALAVISLKQIQLATNLEAIDTIWEERSTTVRQLKDAYEEAQKRFNEIKAESTKRLEIVKEKIQALEPELHERFKAMDEEDKTKPPEERWTAEKANAALETEQAKLELNSATDAGIIATYEAREREINNIRGDHEKKQNNYKKLTEKVQNIRNQWYPALTNLVTAIGEKFSAAFDNIGCAGEIRISEHEDYDKWSIDIFVKFRNEEPLTQLTGQRQSGGERSLTTIMYLMSLTEHARAPFSLVDEINQGMDQRYERAVHDQLVKVTCQAESGQYFLITPKLLPFLKYHENMKILCVNNGEWLPEATSSGVGNMRQMIEKFARRRAGPAAA